MQQLIYSISSLCLIAVVASAWAKDPISAKRLDQLSGQQSKEFDPKVEWDRKYSRSSFVYGKAPAKFLAENYDYLKENSLVLDMGMGEGRNAVFLAQKGHLVTGVDISSVAVKKARKLAKEFKVKIKAVTASMDKYQIKPGTFDAVICFYYVDRSLNKKIAEWLKPGGILIYEAFTLKERQKRQGTKEPESYYLKDQELLTMFPGFKVLKFEEPHHEKDFRASIILQKI